jgi:hypothetical protein
VGTKERGKISKGIYKTVRESRKCRIGHTKGGEVRIKRTVGLSGRIGCSCASSVIQLMVARGNAGRVGRAMRAALGGPCGCGAVWGPHQSWSRVVGGIRWHVRVDAFGRVWARVRVGVGRVWARVGRVRARVCGVCCHDVVSLCGQAYTPPH